MASEEHRTLMENGHGNDGNHKGSSKEIRHGRTAHNMSSSSLRKKWDLNLVSMVPFQRLRLCLANIQEVILGTKLSVGKHPFLRLCSTVMEEPPKRQYSFVPFQIFEETSPFC
uniref:Uncharacterized protein n=1 Tax=Nelumbo nucifera TaxID=4432 RepID=A0A822Z503_NELNU|nr:TPA_asm: hypothetical protein HUJ06_012867 [Nelumbo nucifera]